MKPLIEASLIQFLQRLPTSRLKEAAIYAVKAGGKRFRPLVVLSLIESYGIDPLPFVDVATSIEMIHLYSLIHDDLPAMDDDVLRHGVPTIHKQFDEATAILLGDGLLTNAFERVTESKPLQDYQKVKLVELLTTRAGLNGMVYGQFLDIEAEGKQADVEHLKLISRHKTGKLIEASFRMGAMIAAPQDEERWGKIGLNLGLMFQIQDDVLEITATEAELQKSKSDVALNKATFVSQLGINKAKEMIKSLYQEVQKDLSILKVKKPTIIELINKIYDRRY
ncbi:MAG: geranyltranstransferase [Bacillota bacterium]|jgi:geranylgeranyl diphosphate synthase type II